MSATPAKKPTSLDLVEALRRRYPPEAFATLEQVANGTGARANRWADVVVMALWPSRGLTIDGFEVKVSRSDWRRELAQPEKADAIGRYCDRWWVVAPGRVVEPDEVPETWGLMELRGGRLHVVKEAPRRAPDPLSREFIAAILRSNQKLDTRVLEKARAEGLQKGLEEGRANLERAETGIRDLQANIDAFQAASGIRLSRWADIKDSEGLGAAVTALRRATGGASQLRGAAESILKGLDALEVFADRQATRA